MLIVSILFACLLAGWLAGLLAGLTVDLLVYLFVCLFVCLLLFVVLSEFINLSCTVFLYAFSVVLSLFSLICLSSFVCGSVL